MLSLILYTVEQHSMSKEFEAKHEEMDGNTKNVLSMRASRRTLQYSRFTLDDHLYPSNFENESLHKSCTQREAYNLISYDSIPVSSTNIRNQISLMRSMIQSTVTVLIIFYDRFVFEWYFSSSRSTAQPIILAF